MSKNSKNTRKQKATERKKQRQREEQQYQESISRFFRKSEEPPRKEAKRPQKKSSPIGEKGEDKAPNSWGGRREGAGRKKADADSPRRHYALYCNEEERDFLRFALEKYRIWKKSDFDDDEFIELAEKTFAKVASDFSFSQGL